jgi:hypothetical protein
VRWSLLQPHYRSCPTLGHHSPDSRELKSSICVRPTLPVSNIRDSHQRQLRPNARVVALSVTKLPPKPWVNAVRSAATSKTPFVRSATKRTRRSSTTRTGALRRKLEDPGVSLTKQPTRKRKAKSQDVVITYFKANRSWQLRFFFSYISRSRSSKSSAIPTILRSRLISRSLLPMAHSRQQQ